MLHLAAQTTVQVANRNPVSTLDTNIRGTWALLEACRRTPTVQQIVIASSDKAYGDQEVLPYKEDAPVMGRHPYDVSKSCADLLSQMYAKSYDLPVAVTRCGNFFGGGDLELEPARAGDDPIGRPRRAADHPVRRSVHARLHLRRGRRRGLPAARRADGREAASPRRGLQLLLRDADDGAGAGHQAARDDGVDARARRAQRGVERDQGSVSRRDQGADECWAGRRAFTLDAGLRATVDWYQEYFRG